MSAQSPSILSLIPLLIAVAVLPAADPVLVAAIPVDADSVELQWTGDAGGWLLERSPDRRAWQTVTTLTSGTGRYTCDGLPSGGLVCFRLRDGARLGNWLHAVPLEPVSTAQRPIAPVARWTAADAVQLRWQDPFSDETGWEIQRDTGSGFVTVATPGSGTTAWQTGGLDATVATSWRLRAVAGGSASAWSLTIPTLVDADYRWNGFGGSESVIALATTLTTALTPPDQLAVTDATPTRIDLSWRDRSSTEAGFSIQQSWDGERYLEVGTVAADTTSWSHHGVQLPGRQRWYRVMALDGDDQRSSWASALAVTPPEPDPGLATPAAPTVTTVGDDVRLDWDDPGTPLTAIIVERSTDQDPRYEEVALLAASARSWTDTQAYSSHRWRLRWRDGSAFSTASAGASQPEPALRDPLPAPGLANQADGIVRISWSAASGYANGYAIERAPSGSPAFATVGWVASGTTSWDDRSAVPGSDYDYRVTPTGYLRRWAPGGVASITVASAAAAPTAPDQLAATGVATDQIALAWRNRSAAVEDLLLQRRPAASGTFTTIADLPPASQSWTDRPPSAGSWTYRIQVGNAAGSKHSATVTTATAASDPTATAAVESSPMGPRVVVRGSIAADTIAIGGGPGGLTVTIDGVTALDLADPPPLILVDGGQGDDQIDIDAQELRIQVWTGPGSDHVTVRGDARTIVVALGGGQDDLEDHAGAGTTFWCDTSDDCRTTTGTVLRRITSCYQPWNQDPTMADHVTAEPDGRTWTDPANWDGIQSERFPGPDLWGPQGPVAFDVNQGFQQICGDTSFHAALADRHPRFVEDMLCDLGDGTYLYRFGAGDAPGSWARFDADASAFGYGVPGPGGGIWWPMIEKAIFGFGLPYAPEARNDSRSVDLQQSADDLYDLLAAELAADAVVTVRTIGTGVLDAPFVHQEHAYSLLGLHRRADGTPVAILRNPYGICQRAAFNSPFVRHWRYQGLITVDFAALQSNCAYAFSSRLPAAPVGNSPPVIDSATADPDPVTGRTTTLAATATDADDDLAALVWSWELVSAPTGATPVIAQPDTASSLVTFDLTGSYTFRCRVVDPAGALDETTVSLQVVATPSSIVVEP